jgi:hypothetical protein
VWGGISGLAAGTLTVSPDALTARLEPDFGLGRGFASGEPVTAVVVDSLRNTSGDRLRLPHAFGFRVASGPGSGDFADAVLLNPDSVQTEIATADLDRDGRADIVALLNGLDEIVVYLNRTTPGDSLQFEATSFDLGGYYDPSWLTTFDADNDGDIDLAAAASATLGGYAIVLGRNDGSGESYAWTTWPAGSLTEATGLTPGDFDGDGILDLAFAADGDKVFVHHGDGAGGVRETGVTAGLDGAVSLAAGDVDLDGLLDLVVARTLAAPGRVSVLRNVDPRAEGGARFAVSSTADLTWPRSPVVEDLTGDGRPDVAVTTTDLGVAVLPMQACGVLGPATYYESADCAASSMIRSLAAMDVDGDRDLDLLATFESCSAFTILENDSTGGFGWRDDAAALWTPNEGLAADFDGDGILDVATTLRPVEIFLGIDARVSVPAAPPAPRAAVLRARPNPFSDAVTLEVPGEGPLQVEVFDVAGRLLWRAEAPDAASSGESVRWEGRDRAGREVPAGIYTVRARRQGGWLAAKILRMK